MTISLGLKLLSVFVLQFVYPAEAARRLAGQRHPTVGVIEAVVLALRSWGMDEQQPYIENRAMARLAVDRDLTAQPFHNFFGDGQS